MHRAVGAAAATSTGSGSPGRREQARAAVNALLCAVLSSSRAARVLRATLLAILIVGGCLPFLFFLLPKNELATRRLGEAASLRTGRRHSFNAETSAASDFGTGPMPKANSPHSFSFEAASTLWSHLKHGSSGGQSDSSGRSPRQLLMGRTGTISGSFSSDRGRVDADHSSEGDPVKGNNAAVMSDQDVEEAGFNWRGYLLRNGHVRQQGIRTASDAYRHYLEKGKALGLRHDRLQVILRYSACQGLFNQVYAHLAAFMLADKLDADLVLPPSLYRQSFQHHFSTDPEHNQVKWQAAPVGYLFDVDHIRAVLAARGRAMILTPSKAPLPDCNTPHYAFPQYTQPGTLDVQTTLLPDVYMASQSLDELWDRAANAVVKQHSTLTMSGYPDEAPIVLDLPSTFFSVMTMSFLEAAQAASLMLRFNSTLSKMASSIHTRMELGEGEYNGVHLRLEKDASDWLVQFGGPQKYLQAYSSALGKAGITREKSKGRGRPLGPTDDLTKGGAEGRGLGGKASAVQDLYIASGLMGYAGDEEKDMLWEFLGPHAGKLHYKELYLTKEELGGLNSEQLALLDFLVLADAKTFVGLGSSTFSVYLREYRKILGHNSKFSNVFVKSKAIGTDVIFQRCTHVFSGNASSPHGGENRKN